VEGEGIEMEMGFTDPRHRIQEGSIRRLCWMSWRVRMMSMLGF